MILFTAGWSNPSFSYGISVATPAIFSDYLREFFVSPSGWYYRLSGQDSQGRSVEVRALIDGSGAGIPALKNDLIHFLKYGGNPRIGSIRLPVLDFMTLHLLANVYHDGLFLTADTWTMYPGSKGGPNAALGPVVGQFAKLFRDHYVSDLLFRHRPSTDSGEARNQGKQVDFYNQMNTVHLNTTNRSHIDGKNILVIDDFVTEGYSVECARTLLFKADAATVNFVCFGKYGYGSQGQRVVTPKRNYNWDPYVPTTHPSGSYLEARHLGTISLTPLDAVQASYQRIAAS